MDIEKIKADREAGISVEWFAAQPNGANGWWIVSTDPEGENCIDESGDGGFEEATANRIASVYKLEDAIIAQDALIKELVEALEISVSTIKWWQVEHECCHGATDYQLAKINNALDKAKAAQ